MIRVIGTLIQTSVVTASLFASANLLAADDIAVKVNSEIASVDVMHNGKKVTIMRNQDQKNTVNPAFAKTSRKCPPFCIQPMQLAPGVETIGEVEMLCVPGEIYPELVIGGIQDPQDPAAVCHDLVVLQRGARMENHDVLQPGCGIQA
mgnify:CR=1 FL=1